MALNIRRFVLEVEGYDNGGADDGEVDAQAQPGEKGALVGTVVATVRGDVGEE